MRFQTKPQLRNREIIAAGTRQAAMPEGCEKSVSCMRNGLEPSNYSAAHAGTTITLNRAGAGDRVMK
jgi:hypothetical protein